MLCQYNNIYKRKKKSTNERPKIKTVTTVATVPPGIVATVQNYKKKKDKVAHQNCTVDEQWKTLYEQWQNTIAA